MNILISYILVVILITAGNWTFAFAVWTKNRRAKAAFWFVSVLLAALAYYVYSL